MQGELADNEQAKPPASRKFLEWDLWAGLLPMIAIAPMMLFRSASMWASPQLQFFPFVWISLFVFVAQQKCEESGKQTCKRIWLAVGMFVIGCLVYLRAVWIFSPWLAHLAAILIFWAWGLGRLGSIHWGAVSGWAGFFATALTFPFGWDVTFARWLQGIAAWCCAKALDALSIPNLWIANSFELEGLQFYVDEVCGGWASVYALASIAAALLIVQHRSFVVALLTMVVVPVAMVITDFLRLLSVALAHHHWQRNIADGLDNTLLVVVTFVLSVFSVWMVIRMLSTLTEPVPVADAEFGPVFSTLNKALCWPQVDPLENTEPEDPDDRKHFLKLKAQREAANAARPKLQWNESPALKWTVILTSSLILLCSIFPLALIVMGKEVPRFTRPIIAAEVATKLSSVQPPVALEDWALAANEPATRVDPKTGKKSLGWQYLSTKNSMFLTVSYADRGWQDPTDALTRRGWMVEGKDITTGDAGWPVLMAELENDLGGKAYVLSSLLTGSMKSFEGLPNREVASSDEGAKRRNILSLIGGEGNTEDSTTMTVELFCESGEALTREEQQQMEERFLELRRVFLSE